MSEEHERSLTRINRHTVQRVEITSRFGIEAVRRTRLTNLSFGYRNRLAHWIATTAVADFSNGCKCAGSFGRRCSIESPPIMVRVTILREACDVTDCGTINRRRGELRALEIVGYAGCMTELASLA